MAGEAWDRFWWSNEGGESIEQVLFDPQLRGFVFKTILWTYIEFYICPTFGGAVREPWNLLTFVKDISEPDKVRWSGQMGWDTSDPV